MKTDIYIMMASSLLSPLTVFLLSNFLLIFVFCLICHNDLSILRKLSKQSSVYV